MLVSFLAIYLSNTNVPKITINSGKYSYKGTVKLSYANSNHSRSLYIALKIL